MRDRARVLPLLAALLLGLACAGPAVAAEVTIGANVNQSVPTSGTCAYKSAGERPCVFVNTIVPGQTTTAPCDGTVTRFRLNGIPKPANSYRLRVLTKNADGSFTGTATSAAVTIATNGVNEYVTSLPIAAGQYIGIDFGESTEEFGLRWVEAPGSGAYYINAFPADGGSALPTGPTSIYYLYNADIACAPSNAFKVLKLKKTTLSVELASVGALTVAGKGKAKLLKSSKVTAGPGRVKIALRLTPKAKAKLAEKGKLRVRATLTFTPTGGSAATQVRSFTLRKSASHPR